MMKKQFVLGILSLFSTFYSTSISAADIKDFSEMGRKELETYARELEGKVNAVENTLTDSLEVLLDEKSNDWVAILNKANDLAQSLKSLKKAEKTNEYSFFDYIKSTLGYTNNLSDEDIEKMIHKETKLTIQTEIANLIEQNSTHVQKIFANIDPNPDAIADFLSYYYERQLEGILNAYPHNHHDGKPIEKQLILLFYADARKNDIEFDTDYKTEFYVMQNAIETMGVEEYIAAQKAKKGQSTAQLIPPPPPPLNMPKLSTARLGRAVKGGESKKGCTKINGQVVQATFSSDILAGILKGVAERAERVAKGETFVKKVEPLKATKHTSTTQVSLKKSKTLSEITSSSSPINYSALFINTTSTTTAKSEPAVGSDIGEHFAIEQGEYLLYDDEHRDIFNQFITAARKNGNAGHDDEDDGSWTDSDSE